MHGEFLAALNANIQGLVNDNFVGGAVQTAGSGTKAIKPAGGSADPDGSIDDTRQGDDAPVDAGAPQLLTCVGIEDVQMRIARAEDDFAITPMQNQKRRDIHDKPPSTLAASVVAKMVTL